MKWLEFIFSLLSDLITGNKKATSSLLLDTVNNLTMNKEQSPTNQSNYIWETRVLISQLEKMGFYKYADPSMIEGIKKEAIEKDYVFCGEFGREFPADAEALGQCGLSDFFKEIKDFLDKQNVIINISEENAEENGYHITINDCSYEIYSEQELQQDWWKLSSIRCFSIINKLLEEAGSKERIYHINDGNDQFAIFLTEEMYQSIYDHCSLAERDKPKFVGNIFR